MRIMVLGGAGFLGSPLVVSLAKTRANEVQVFDTFTHGFPRKPFKRKNIAPPISGSVNNYYDVLRSMERFEPEVVVHLAAHNSRPETFGDFRLCAHTNYLGTANVAQACLALRKKVKRLIFASTLAAETPLGHFGISKRAAEDLLCSIFPRFPEMGVDLGILRFAEVYGSGEPHSSTSLVNFLVDTMLTGQGIALYSVKASIDCIHVSEAAVACHAAVEAESLKGNRLDIGTGKGIIIQDIVGKVKELTGYEGQLRFLDNPRVPIQDLVAYTYPAKDKLGFQSSANFDEQLAALVKKRRKVVK